MNWSVFYFVALANAIPTVSKLEVTAKFTIDSLMFDDLISFTNKKLRF